MPLLFFSLGSMLPVWWQLQREPGHFGQASEWLLLDSFLNGQALLHLHAQARAAAPIRRVLLAAIDGECHELELLVTDVLLSGAGLHVRNQRLRAFLAEC